MNLANLYNYFICIQNNVPYNGVTKFEIPLSSKDPNLQNSSAIISFAVDKLSYIFQNKKFDYTSFNQVIEEVIRLKQNNFVKLKDLYHNENDCFSFIKYTVQANLESAVDNAQRTLENLLLLQKSSKEPYKTEYLLAKGELKDNLDNYGLLNDNFRKFIDRNIQTYKDLIVNKPILFDDLGSYKISLSELYDINLDLLYKTKDEYIKQQYKEREDSLLHHPDSAENQLYKTIKNKNLQQVFEVLFQKQLLFSSGEQDHHLITINEIPKLFDKHIRLFEDEPFDLKIIDFNQNCINLSAKKICLIAHYLKFFNKELNQLFKENIYEKSRENRF